MSYDLYLVPNGRRHDFERGYTGGDYPEHCRLWGSFDTLEEARQRLAELVEEDLDGEEYPGGRIAVPIPKDFDADDDDQVRAYDAEIEKKKKELVEWASRILFWEWQDDLQYLMVVKTDEDRSIWEICHG